MSELLNRVNWLDIFALILLIRISYVSLRIGVGKQFLPILFLTLILLCTWYYYSVIASFFISRYYSSPSISKFLSYLFVMSVCFIIYHIVLRLIGFYSVAGEDEGGFIEVAGGAFLGVLRSIFIIGIIVTCLGLAPVKFIEDAVRNSYSGVFFINTNLKIYNFIINSIHPKSELSYQKTLKEFLSEKESYLFKPFDLKRKSRFFIDVE